MAHVAVASRLDTLAAKDRHIAGALHALVESTGSNDSAMETIIEGHLRLASALEAVAARTRENDM